MRFRSYSKRFTVKIQGFQYKLPVYRLVYVYLADVGQQGEIDDAVFVLLVVGHPLAEAFVCIATEEKGRVVFFYIMHHLSKPV